MKLTGKVVKRDDDKFLVFGFASVADVEDSQGDVISIEELEKGAYKFMLRGGMGAEMHEVYGVADVVESIVFTKEKLKLLGLAEDALPPAWWIGMKVRDAEVWQKIKNGDYKSFSIGGRAIREAIANE